MAVRSENGERLVAVFVLKVLFGHAEVFGEFLFRQIVNGSGKEEETAVRLMQEHLLHVEQGLTFDRDMPTSDLSMALSSVTN